MYFLDPNPAGFPIALLLHGLGADAESWSYQFPALVKAGLRPIAPDLPGFGRSAAPLHGWTISRTTAQLADLLDELDSKPAYVIGLSLGGALAQQLAIDHPEKVSKLVLVNTFACLRPRHINDLAYLLKRILITNIRGSNAQAETVAWRIFPGSDQEELRRLTVEKIKAADPVVYRAAMRALALFDTRRKLGQIRIPTLIISAFEDNTVSLEIQRVLMDGIPGARQVLIHNAGHAVTIDQPELVNQALIKFLKESGAAAAAPSNLPVY